MLKEKLDLSTNKLTNIQNGGCLKDLITIKLFNLNNNRIKKLPNDIFHLENLRELYIANNNLEALPETINKLRKLELLDVSSNKLTNLDSIQLMPCLRILNTSNNIKLFKLPFGLATCDSLIDIILDVDTVVFPPKSITHLGTQKIIEYLMENCDSNMEQTFNIEKITERFIAVEKNQVILINFIKSLKINYMFYVLNP